jgi:hypothetical protein
MRRIDMLGAVAAAADEYEPLAVDHAEAGTGTIGQVFVAGHG